MLCYVTTVIVKGTFSVCVHRAGSMCDTRRHSFFIFLDDLLVQALRDSFFYVCQNTIYKCGNWYKAILPIPVTQPARPLGIRKKIHKSPPRTIAGPHCAWQESQLNKTDVKLSMLPTGTKIKHWLNIKDKLEHLPCRYASNGAGFVSAPVKRGACGHGAGTLGNCFHFLLVPTQAFFPAHIST